MAFPDFRIWIKGKGRGLFPFRSPKIFRTSQTTVFSYLLRKNERDRKTTKFEDLLGQIRKVFSAFPGVLKPRLEHLSSDSLQLSQKHLSSDSLQLSQSSDPLQPLENH